MINHEDTRRTHEERFLKTFVKSSCIFVVYVFLSLSIFAQTQTTGRIAGTVQDQNNAIIVGANVTITSQATGEERTIATDAAGNFAFAFLAPGVYRVRIEAKGFNAFNNESVTVSITETTTVNTTLTVGGIIVDPINVNNDAPLIKTDSPTLGQVFDGRTITGLTLATGNFTQLLGLTAGTTGYLTDNTIVGRNTQNVSVNGARVSQNNFQINGVEANAGISNGLQLANPALESIAEFKVQTSAFDATFGRTGGGSVQILTHSGSNKFSGKIYDYFRTTALTANNPFLKAAGLPRPVLERNVFGVTLGGAIKKDRAFFFVSYQTTRDRNGASRRNSISSNVLIGTGSIGLTDDRSAATLSTRFDIAVAQINSTALSLLNARLPNGQFLIPTPQVGSRYSGSAISIFREEQFNANFDYRLTQKNLFTVKFFFSAAPQTPARDGGVNIPGFPFEQKNANRILSVQDVHVFSPNITNEARFGYNFVRGDNFPNLSFPNFDITRSTADAFPGLPLISIAANAGGITFGTGFTQDQKLNAPTLSFADTVSITRERHSVRFGAEFRSYQFNITRNTLTRGTINFQDFRSFLTGTNNGVGLGNGINRRDLRTADYNFFVQDDWKLSPKLTLNLGLRYELDLPPYDTEGRISTFDASLYRPRLSLFNGSPAGPPVGGIVQAGNPADGYDLSDVPNVGKRVLNSIDPNNFAPRFGFAYSPFKSNRVVVRGGYGIFYSRLSFQYLAGNMFSPPFYFANFVSGTPFSNPFPAVPSQFPTIVEESLLFGISFDRRNRTPYLQQYNISLQFGLAENTLLEIAYVGTRGVKLIRRAAVNQARLASTQNPIVNDVTGAMITTNTPANAQLRASFQGVSVAAGTTGFVQDQTSGKSNYNSMQLTLTRRFSRGLQLLASYTFAKSIDNGSGVGGGAGTNGLIDAEVNNDSSQFDGDQRSKNSNRGVSDFDRTHRFVLSFLWELPQPNFAKKSKFGRVFFSGWQMSGIYTAMSGLPINIRDAGAATFFFGGINGGGDRPNWESGISATNNIPNGYYFNPFAFYRPTVLASQPIPSSNGTATANATGTDFGNVGRNILRGPKQFNTDFSISKRFHIDEVKNIEFRAEIFNLFNTVNYANPISNFAAVQQSGGTIDPNTGRISGSSAGDFGRIISTSNNPRLVQLALKFNF